MKILITGAAGFIGFHLSKRLLTLGHEVFGLDNINDYYDVNLKYARLKELGIKQEGAQVYNNEVLSTGNDLFRFINLNIEDRENLPRLFKKENFEVVCNLAAQAGVRYSLENPETYIDSNIVGFLNILECCRHHSIKHLIYASSSSVYGQNKKTPFSIDDNVDHPISLYAATKKSNELMAYTYSHLYDLPVTGLRFFTVYGPWGRPDMAIYLFTKAIVEDKSINVFNNGNMSRDFTYIDDIIRGIEISFNNKPKKTDCKPPYQLFNIGNGSPQSLMDFIAAIESSTGKTAIKNFLPMQPGDVMQTFADTTKLEMLGYASTTSIAEGVKYFVEWYKNFYSNYKLL